jgi:hypothetical protein
LYCCRGLPQGTLLLLHEKGHLTECLGVKSKRVLLGGLLQNTLIEKVNSAINS